MSKEISAPGELMELINRFRISKIILDHIMNEEHTEPAIGAFFALNMLVGTLHGDTYTENEVRTWMHASGLHSILRTESPAGTTLISGIK